jgi:hypothetical protein
MSKLARELYEKLVTMTAPKDNILPAIVMAVNTDNRTVDVDFDDNEIGDVRLQASTIANQGGNILFPKVGSVVLIQRFGSSNEFFVSLFSELDSQVIQIDTTQVKADTNGVLIQRGDNNMMQVLNDFMTNTQKMIDEVNKIVVAIGNGPDVAALTQLRQAMESNKTILNQILQ